MKALQDNAGNTSITRILAAVKVAAGVAIAFYCVYRNYLNYEAVTLILGLCGVAVAEKLIGKKLEK